MLYLLTEFFSLLTRVQKKRFYMLQIMVVVQSFMEVSAVASVGPFMALVGDPGILERDNALGRLYRGFEFTEPSELLIWAGFAVLAILTISALVSSFVQWKLIRFGAYIGMDIGSRLYKHYLRQNWLFHVGSNSAYLTKQISSEANRLTRLVIQPLLNAVARTLFAILMSIGLLIYHPAVTITGLLIFSTAYLTLYRLVRSRVLRNGRGITSLLGQRYQLMLEAFSGIRDIILHGRESYFVDRFEVNGKELVKRQSNNLILQTIPGRFIELITFAVVILLILFLLGAYGGDPSAILPVLSVFAMAGFKLLPAFQSIYLSMAQIKSGIPAYEAIRDDLVDSLEFENGDFSNLFVTPDTIKSMNESMEFNGVTFSYPGTTTPAIDNVSFKIKAGTKVGIVGPTGAGKSTVADLILGLIEPGEGTIRIDGELIEGELLKARHRSIGSIPQLIHLADTTVEENIAFGIPREEIDPGRMTRAIDIACLGDVIDGLPEGLNTNIGERGMKLSGGQRQRIGIARAVYQDSSLMLFDEATSALDGMTEKKIMEAIDRISQQKTVVMIAHRLSTIENCDQVLLLDRGRLVDSGTYAELIQRNPVMQKMASSGRSG